MPHYFLGVDTGATKSQALIADVQGHALGFGEAGPGNPMDIGYAAFADLLQTVVQQALDSAGINLAQIYGAGFGIGGYDWPSQRPAILKAIETLGLNASLELVNDALIGLLAGTAAGWGVAVVAGTSCNAWGLDTQGRAGRMTGFAWLGESAGSSELVLKALQAVALAWTQRGPSTRLSAAFVEHAGMQDVEQLLEALTLEQITVRAEAAPLVFNVAAQGDMVAQDLIRWAGAELGSLAIGVIRQLDFENETFEVVLAGSFFKGSPTLTEVMGHTIHQVAPGAKLARLLAPPVMGGVVLGMQQAGLATPDIHQTLIHSTNQLAAQKSERSDTI